MEETKTRNRSIPKRMKNDDNQRQPPSAAAVTPPLDIVGCPNTHGRMSSLSLSLLALLVSQICEDFGIFFHLFLDASNRLHSISKRMLFVSIWCFPPCPHSGCACARLNSIRQDFLDFTRSERRELRLANMHV